MYSQMSQKKKLISIGLLIVVLAVLMGALEEVQAKPLAGGYDCTSNVSISFDDCAVLVTLYVETGGASWTLSTNWFNNDPCTWYGITCDGGPNPQEITDIYLGDNNLIGTIPPELGTLISLRVLYLTENSLTGSIPTELGSLINLDWLVLRNNSLIGTLPLSLGSLSNLTVLVVNDNHIAGEVPPELGNLSNLEFLLLNNNLLYGKLPQTLINLTGLNTFNFHDTSLCEPQNIAFQAWLSTLVSVSSTGLPCTLFSDDFETGDFSLWTRVNTGKGYLYPCHQAAINGTWGACVDRGTDKRKQLIDETPVNQTTFFTRFNIDINSLSMAEGTRFRFMQVKMGAERPFFIVLKYQGGQYKIQLNTLRDDLTKVKTGWHVLSNAPHTIEVEWQAASGVAADDGWIEFFLDDVLLEWIYFLDNDSIFVDTFKIGFTSRLDGKPISGIFYLDDIATSNLVHLGLP